jgi:Response regulator containing CheY-like receiver, AAA-type ATPase, and DNA-binding domains
MNAEFEPSQQPPGGQVAILFIDDDSNDVLLVQRALNKAGLSYPLIHKRDGEEAIDYLSGKPPYSDRAKHPLPELILLDIKMPKINGFDVLGWLQRQPALAKIPVVILTASVRVEDRSEAEKLGAVGYRTKPVDFGELVNIIRDVDARWLSQIKAR